MSRKRSRNKQRNYGEDGGFVEFNDEFTAGHACSCPRGCCKCCTTINGHISALEDEAGTEEDGDMTKRYTVDGTKYSMKQKNGWGGRAGTLLGKLGTAYAPLKVSDNTQITYRKSLKKHFADKGYWDSKDDGQMTLLYNDLSVNPPSYKKDVEPEVKTPVTNPTPVIAHKSLPKIVEARPVLVKEACMRSTACWKQLDKMSKWNQSVINYSIEQIKDALESHEEVMKKLIESLRVRACKSIDGLSYVTELTAFKTHIEKVMLDNKILYERFRNVDNLKGMCPSLNDVRDQVLYSKRKLLFSITLAI